MTTDAVVEKNTKNKTLEKIKPPSKYNVIVCNDDVTPMEFVVSMLMGIFKHDNTQAIDITLKIHNSGSAIAGVFNYEIAEQKAVDAINLARTNNFPLIIKVEPE